MHEADMSIVDTIAAEFILFHNKERGNEREKTR